MTLSKTINNGTENDKFERGGEDHMVKKKETKNL